MKRSPGNVGAESQPAKISILIATGMPGGTYYQIGLSMASLWTTKLRPAGIRVSAAISEGSRENIDAIRISDADLIIADELFCSMAHNGTGVYRGQPLKELRSISALWPETVNLLIRSDRVKQGLIQDLEGLSLSTGLPDSGNRYTTELLLNTVKSLKQSVKVRSMTNVAAVEALRNGTVQAVDLTGGTPVPLVLSLFQEWKSHLSFVEITDSQLEAVRTEGWKNAFRTVIAANTYPAQEKPVNTIGQNNVLATTEALNAEVVYAVTKTLFENLDILAKAHPACKTMSLNKALSGLLIPLHPGATRFYKEKNINIPDSLITP